MIIPDTVFLPADAKDLYSIFKGNGILHKVELFESIDKALMTSKQQNNEPVVLYIHAKEMIRDGLELHLDNDNKLYTKDIPIMYISSKKIHKGFIDV